MVQITNHPLARLHQAPMEAVHCSVARPLRGRGSMARRRCSDRKPADPPLRSWTCPDVRCADSKGSAQVRALAPTTAGPLYFSCCLQGRAARGAVPRGEPSAKAAVISILVKRTPPVAQAQQIGATGAGAVVNVTSLRSRAAHRPQCDGPRWRRGCRNTSRPGGGCPESARLCSRW